MNMKFFGVQVLLGALILNVQGVPLHSETKASAYAGANSNLWAMIEAETDMMLDSAAEDMITTMDEPLPMLPVNDMPTSSMI